MSTAGGASVETLLEGVLERFKLKTNQQAVLIRSATLLLIWILAFAVRLTSVLRYEVMIHEFDPYFNYRSTVQLVEKGWYEFWNWFDYESWYPLGRVVGGTVYPGIMATAGMMYWILEKLSMPIDIRTVCVFVGPFFAGNTCLVAYFFGKELSNPGTGLTAAALMSVVPGYVSRSAAGSYDNEAVSIFALLLTFYLFVKAVRTGSLAWAAAAAFSYFYMASAWGGYIFISNVVAIYGFIMVISRRFNDRVYTAYCTFFVLGTILAMQIRFIGFNHVQSSEHLAFILTFIGMQVFQFLRFVKTKLVDPKLFERAVSATITAALMAVGGALLLLFASGKVAPWTGRFWTLLDPTYAKKFIPIIASVAEHQPTTWASYFFDLHQTIMWALAGLYVCIKAPNDSRVFLLVYSLTSLYFAGVMVRLMLVLAPAVIMLSAVAISHTLDQFVALMADTPEDAAKLAAKTSAAADKRVDKKAARGSGKSTGKASAKSGDELGDWVKYGATIVVFLIALGLTKYVKHCTWVSSEAYSSPSIVLIANAPDGSRIVFDDYREAYYWLHQNTEPGSRIMSWWDYGYQITAMGNRTVLVDNNTWNNTHIATVGRAMALPEDQAYETMLALDVDYVLVIFGGLAGYSSDDINKFLWMVRIGGGVFGDVNEADYLTETGDYTMGPKVPTAMKNSLMYKLCYYRFGEVRTSGYAPPGFDRVRQYEIGEKNIELQHVEEAFTSEHWIVRIYKVKKPSNRE